MTNKEAIAILKPLFEQCKGTNECLGYIEHYFSKDEELALDLAIKALEFTESQRICCDNCVNHNRKGKDVCTSPYGQCEFFEDKDVKQVSIPYTWLTGVQ